jgi:DNA invertase Pin-like site-specific DNA recombinase
VSRKKVTDKLRAQMSAMGKVGGKRRLVTMSKAKRIALAYQAGVQGGAPIRIDHEKVRELRAQGLKYREIAEQMGISVPSVSRIVKERK